jgi:hypothetical protein
MDNGSRGRAETSGVTSRGARHGQRYVNLSFDRVEFSQACCANVGLTAVI